MELRIKEICKEQGIMLKDLAERINITEVGLSKSINGNPTLQRLKEIAKALNVDFLELFVSTKETDKEILYIKREGNYLPIGTINIP